MLGWNCLWRQATIATSCALLLLNLCLPGWSLVAPNAPNYLPDVLIGGRQVQRWNDQTRIIYVTIQPGYNVPGWNPVMVDLVKQSFAEWQNALGNKFQFQFTNDVRYTDVMVIWHERSKGVEVGSQTIRWSQDTITQADLELSLYSPEGNRFNTQQLKAIALHEIGHVLGLRGHSTNTHDIMYPSMTPQATGLSARDINTMRALYRLKPNISNPIGAHLMAYRYYMYYLSMGIQANNNGNNTQAMDYFKKATQYYPNDPRINYYLGMGSYNNKQYSQAIAQLTKAIPNLSGDPGMLASAQFFLAQASMAQGINDMKAKRSTEGRKHLQDANSYFSLALQSKELPTSLRQVAVTNQQRLKQMS